MLSVLSYNIFLGKKIYKIFEWYKLLNYEYDLICLQEYPESKISYFMEVLGEDYSYIFAPTIKVRRTIYGQLTVFNKKKLTLLNHRLIYHGKSVIDRIYSRNDAERAALLTQFQYEKKKFVVVNCHLTPLTYNKRRIQELKIITEQIRKTDSAIIVGDYNYPYLRKSGLLKFMAANDFINPTPRFKTYKLLVIKFQYDYLFYRNCTMGEVKIVNVNFSDHKPLIAHFDPELKMLDP